MDVDENVFFREATLRICSSLDIGTALKRCFEYIRAFIPANGMTLHILDPDLNLLKFVASVGLNQVNERVLPLPEKGRDKRAADLQAALLTDEGKVLILHPDKEPGLPEILEQLGINANISLMNLILQLEGNQIGTLALYVDGLNQYAGEHARLLQLLHDPFAMAMSKALEHQETIERTAELRRSEAYLAETQRLSHTGSWVWNPIHSEFLYASEEMLRLYGFDPQKGMPTPTQVLERIHPDDRDKIKMTGTGKTDVDFDYKFVLPDGTLKHFHCIAHPVLGPSGETPEVVGIAMDITDHKRAEEERLARVWFLESMDRINQAMQGTNDLGQIMRDVLDAMLSLFECDRAFLVYPCDPDTPSFEAIMERTRPGYSARRGPFPTDSDNTKHFRLYLASSGAVTLGPGCDYPLDISRFGEKSKMMIALYPKTGKPWVLGMHQCSYPRVWSEGEKKLLGEIARRMGDVLTSLLAYRDLQESEERHRVTLQTAMDGFFRADTQGQILEVNETYCRMSGYSEQELLTMHIADIEAVHSAEMIAGNIRRFTEEGPQRFESVHRRKNGSLFDVEISGQYQAIAGAQVVVFVRDITEHKRIEEALRQSEAYLAEAQRLSHTGSWAFDLASNKYLYASEEGYRIFELDPQEGLPTREAVSRRIHPGDWDRVNADFEKFLCEKGDSSSEFRLVLPRGTVKHVQTIRHPVLNSAGDVVGIVGTTIDITERKRHEEALRRIAGYLAETQRLTHTGTFVGDDTTKPLYWSDELFRIFGFDPQYGLPTRDEPLQRIHPEDRDKFLQTFQRVIRQKVDSGVEYKIVLPDGTVKHVYGLGHPVLNANGEIAEVVGTTIDITARKRAEEEINSLKNYLSSIIDSMPSILVGMDNSRTVTQWNRQAEAFTGIPAGEAIGKQVADFLPDFAPWIMTMGTDMDEQRPSSMEKLLIVKEGERRFYDLMLYPLLIDSVEGAVLRIEDVTERARIQELMVQTEKMMSIGGLAAGMAHEINNPLGIITQAAQNIERRISLELPANRKVSEELGLNLEGIRAYFDKRQIPDAIASIRTASARAAKIVSNMLQFSRCADAITEPASFAQIVDQALELAASDYDLKKKYDFRSIEIIKDYQDTPQVPMVSFEIEQVILNLLKNAAQAMTATPPDRRPTITLRLRCEGWYAVLEVEDNGPGMTEDIRRRVFEPFFTTKEPGAGTGLGLSVSYMIVTQNHKGAMEVQSTPGRGTFFKVRLPIGGEQT